MSAHLTVDLGTLRANLAHIRGTVAPAAHLLVVKDDAYGHGLAPVVRTAVTEGVSWFGTFDVATAVEVRRVAGPAARIIAWTVYDRDEIAVALEEDIDLGLGTEALIDLTAREAAARGGAVRVHLKVDTGLHRNGVRPERWPGAAERARRAERDGALHIAGVWSHIAEASDDDDDISRAVFLDAVDTLGHPRPLRHLAASAAGFARASFRFDLVRIGAFAYGIRPAGGPSDAALGIRPVATLVGSVVAVDDDAVRIDVGALDGLDSRLAGRMPVGTPAGPRMLRAVAAAHAVADPWPTAAPGNDVLIFGAGAPCSATDAAELVGTIGEETILRVSPRLPRTTLG